VAANLALCASYEGLARQAKIALQMAFRLGNRREGIHPFNHFNHALFAFALLAAGRGHVDAQGLGVIEQRLAGPRLN
jgi:hypothetical protein